VTELRNFLIAAVATAAFWLYIAFSLPSVIAGALVFVVSGGFTFLAIQLLVSAGEPRPGSLPLQHRPVVLQRQAAPFCYHCEVDEAVESGDRFRLDRLGLMLAGFPIGDLYQRHRDCWVTTGDEKELARMLRHVTWTAS
jgi:hypothetical protein